MNSYCLIHEGHSLGISQLLLPVVCIKLLASTCIYSTNYQLIKANESCVLQYCSARALLSGAGSEMDCNTRLQSHTVHMVKVIWLKFISQIETYNNSQLKKQNIRYSSLITLMLFLTLPQLYTHIKVSQTTRKC